MPCEIIAEEVDLMSIRTYSELLKFNTINDRYEYLRLDGIVGMDTFGFDRYMNQMFYKSREWRHIRNFVMSRDNGCDLGLEGYDIRGKIIIHHMNPITVTDIKDATDFLLNPEYLISTTITTHNAIHYGDSSLICKGPAERTLNDTCPWKSLGGNEK